MFTEMWWGVWWPWMLVWAVTVGSVVTLAALAVRDLRRRGRPAGRNLNYSICFYLHNTAIMDQYQMGRYTVALRKEVEQRTSDNKDGNIRATVFGIGAGAGRRDSREIVSRYLEVAEPISVIGVIMDVLERNDVIVHVDLVNGTVQRNEALVKALATTHGSRAPQDSVRLRDIEDYVLLRGRFRKISEEPEGTVFLAPYGDPDGPGASPASPRVRVTCASEGLRDEVPRGAFSARCLGKVQDWNAEDAVLEVQAIAIFL